MNAIVYEEASFPTVRPSAEGASQLDLIRRATVELTRLGLKIEASSIVNSAGIHREAAVRNIIHFLRRLAVVHRTKNIFLQEAKDALAALERLDESLAGRS